MWSSFRSVCPDFYFYPSNRPEVINSICLGALGLWGLGIQTSLAYLLLLV